MERLRRIVGSIFLFFLFMFAYSGIVWSNEIQPEEYDPIMGAITSGLENPTVISSGFLAKIFFVPISFALGLATIAVAGPIFGGSWLAARSPRYQRFAERFIIEGRFNSEGLQPVSYLFSVSGLILILTGAARQTYVLNAIGGVLIAVGLIIRGQVESLRVAARAIGARTLRDDLADAAETTRVIADVTIQQAGEAISAGGKWLARKINESTTATSNFYDQATEDDYPIGPSPMVPDTARDWYENFVNMLIDAHGTNLGIIRSRITQLDYAALPRPVMTGRKNLFLGFRTEHLQDRTVPSIDTVKQAIRFFDAGSVHPDKSEWPHDGEEVGRGHACLWGAISRAFLRQQASFIMVPDAQCADTWFALAAIIFLEQNDPRMAGRAFQEWAESRRLYNDFEHSDALFFASYISFMDGKDAERARIAMSRHGSREACSIDSSFFLNRLPTKEESDILTTILGGKNSQRFYSAPKI